MYVFKMVSFSVLKQRKLGYFFDLSYLFEILLMILLRIMKNLIKKLILLFITINLFLNQKEFFLMDICNCNETITI